MVILLLLGLLQAFETVDHYILLSRLKTRFGFEDKVFSMVHVISGHSQFVKVKSSQSLMRDLHYGVLQGSLLRPNFDFNFNFI